MNNKPSEREPNPSRTREQTFADTVSRHGEGFQFAASWQAETAQGPRCKWIVDTLEAPVSVSKKETKTDPGTKIDLILSHEYEGFRYYLAIECKRISPTNSEWCFCRSVDPRDNFEYGDFIAERIEPVKRHATGTNFHLRGAYYHDFGRPIPTSPTSEGKMDDEAIEKAATQACRGMNGLVDFFSTKFARAEMPAMGVILIPAIFTTAKLFTSELLLKNTNLSDGTIASDKISFKEQGWVYYQYEMSPGIRHDSHWTHSILSLNSILRREYLRTIPIVNADSIEGFLQQFEPWNYPKFEDPYRHFLPRP